MIKKVTFIILFVFCSTFILSPKVYASAGSSMFWGIMWTGSAIGCAAAGIANISTSSDYKDLKNMYEEESSEYEYYGDLEKTHSTRGGLWIVGALISGGIAVYCFDNALSDDRDALLNMDKDKFAVAIPSVSYNILKNEGSVNLLKYSF